MPSALRGTAALLAVVEAMVLQSFRILLTVGSGLRAQHSSRQPRVGWDGQKSSSCEQPVGGVRAGHGAPLAAMSRWKTTLEPGDSPSHRITDETLLFL